MPHDSTSKAPSIASLQTGFLRILPRIETHARIFFRYVKCPGKRDDAIAETIAVSWKWYVRLIEQDKDPTQFVSTLATYAVRHVRSGRKVSGQDRSKDALSPLAQASRGFTVSSLPEGSSLNGNVFDEALHDNTITPPPDQAAFRIDFPAWLTSLSQRNQQIAKDMAIGEATQDLAKKHGVSPGRISQLRSQFHQNWQRFTDPPTGTAPLAA